jgi:hypothetical protein
LEAPYGYINEWYDKTDSVNDQFWRDYGWLTKGESNWYIYNRAKRNIDEIQFAIEFDVYITRRDFWLPVLKEVSERILDRTNTMMEEVKSMKH